MAYNYGTKNSDQDYLREQRQELHFFEMMQSDLDVAYNLQLQEALIASVGSVPSSSSSPSPTTELSFFEKPYGEGSSSGGGDEIAIDENLRVYVKGMVTEERVKDVVVSVAGLGVAICDLRDYLILEIRKPLVAGDGKDKGVLSSERVGFEALVEGLKATNELGLKRVSEWKNKKATCFCPLWNERNIIRN